MAVILNTIEVNADPREWLTENINLHTGMTLKAADLVFSLPTSPQTNNPIVRNTQVTVTGVNSIVLAAPILVYYDRADIRTLGRIVLNPRATIYNSLDIISDFSGGRLTREDVVDAPFLQLDGTMFPQVLFAATQNSLMLYGSSHLYPVTNYSTADRNKMAEMVAAYGDLLTIINQLKQATAIIATAQNAHTVLAGPQGGAAFPTFRLITASDLPDVNYALNAGSGIPIVINSATSLLSRGNYEADTTTAGFTVTLPSTPIPGDWVSITDFAGTWTLNNVVVNNNGSLIEGQNTSVTLDVSHEGLTFVYVNAAKGWSIQKLKGAIIPGNSISPNILTGAGTLTLYGDYQLDTSSGPYTVMLPPTPTPGKWVEVSDYANSWGTNPITIDGNGNNINFSPTALIGNASGQAFRLQFINATKGWAIKYLN